MTESDDEEIRRAKVALRAEMLRQMRQTEEAARATASRQASERLLALEEIREAELVLFYMAMRTEIDPAEAMAECLREGVRIAVPKVDVESGELEAIEVVSLADKHFVRDTLGVPVPRHGKLVRVTELDAVVVPGVAFDRAGHRLGRGAGYYDRLLIRLPPRCRTIGFGFGFQLLERVPVDTTDRSVSAVVTDVETVDPTDHGLA